METVDILVPKEKSIQLGGKTVVLKALTFNQLIKLVRFLFGLREGLSLSISDSESFMLDVFEAAEPKLPELIGILINQPPFTPTVEEASDIMLAVAELNDFAKIFANFQKAAAIFQKAMPKAATQSPTPLEK